MKKFKEPTASRYQVSFLPPTLDDAVPRDSVVRILSDTIDKMDCSVLEAAVTGGGAPAYHPQMLFKLVVFAYLEGIRSSRRIAERCTRDIHYMFLTEMAYPDFRTICRFRRRNEAAIKVMFRNTVLLCAESGLVLLEQVAVDGTKIEANVSSKETYSKKRVEEAIAYTDACIEAILQDAEAQDAKSERDEPKQLSLSLPLPVQKKEAIIAKLKRRKERALAAKKRMSEGAGNASGATDPQSRVMKMQHGGNRPAYNAQAAVDGANQIIVAAEVTQDTTDGQQMKAMVAQVIENTGCRPGCVTADCGYLTPETLLSLDAADVTAVIAQRDDQKIKAEYVYDADADVMRLPARPASTDFPVERAELVLGFHGIRQRDGKKFRVYRNRTTGKELWVSLMPEKEMPLRNELLARMASEEGKATYSLRQQTVEPVFGHMKSVLNLRRFLLRGLPGASIEYHLACVAHNLKKCIRAEADCLRKRLAVGGQAAASPPRMAMI